MALAMACSSMVLPVRGAATMSARWPLPERSHEVHDPGGRGCPAIVSSRMRSCGIERGQVVEEDLLLRAVGRLEVDRVHLDEGEVALVLLGRADLAADGVAGAQVELADLRGRDVDVVGPGQVAVLGGAQEAEAVGQDLQHALGEDQPFLLRLRAQDLEDQLLLLHGGRAGDLQRALATWASLVMLISLSAARSRRLPDGAARPRRRRRRRPAARAARLGRLGLGSGLRLGLRLGPRLGRLGSFGSGSGSGCAASPRARPRPRHVLRLRLAVGRRLGAARRSRVRRSLRDRLGLGHRDRRTLALGRTSAAVRLGGAARRWPWWFSRGMADGRLWKMRAAGRTLPDGGGGCQMESGRHRLHVAGHDEGRARRLAHRVHGGVGRDLAQHEPLRRHLDHGHVGHDQVDAAPARERQRARGPGSWASRPWPCAPWSPPPASPPRRGPWRRPCPSSSCRGWSSSRGCPRGPPAARPGS